MPFFFAPVTHLPTLPRARFTSGPPVIIVRIYADSSLYFYEIQIVPRDRQQSMTFFRLLLSFLENGRKGVFCTLLQVVLLTVVFGKRKKRFSVLKKQSIQKQ